MAMAELISSREKITHVHVMCMTHRSHFEIEPRAQNVNLRNLVVGAKSAMIYIVCIAADTRRFFFFNSSEGFFMTMLFLLTIVVVFLSL
jgi:hypothetical protein